MEPRTGKKRGASVREDSGNGEMDDTMVQENILIQEQPNPTDTDTHLIIEAKRGSKLTIGTLPCCDKL